MKFEYPAGSTPIDPDEAKGLIPKNIMFQSELNEYEQANILAAEIWLFKKALPIQKVINLEFIKKLHKKMFGKVWRWAGQFRKSDKNIGCCWTQISMQLQNLCNDVLFQLKRNSFDIYEIAIRFHHRLVSIHPFPNGNGRHARIMADFLLFTMRQARFNWGNKNLVKPSEVRRQYINSLQLADKGDYKPLLSFAKS